jgi:3-hydroxybutyryl-CoA dehydratase
MLGNKASLTKKISTEDVIRFAEISMDHNPIHLDEEYAKKTIFGRKIVHGFLVGSFISAVLANKLPGHGSIYINQEMNFKRPVFIGDEITAEVEVIEIIKPTIYKLSTKCFNQNGDVVIDGFAVIKKV